MRIRKTFLILTIGGGLFAQTTAVDLSSQTKAADFRGFDFTRTIKTGATLPATCTVGDLFLFSPGEAGRNLYYCHSADTWTLQGGEIATQAEATTGLNDAKTMTPLKTSQAIAAQCALPNPFGSGGSLLMTDGSTSSWTRKLIFAPLIETITAATNSIPTTRFYVQVNPSATMTLTSTPTLGPGSDGQFLVLTNISPSNSITLQDQASLPGSGLRLGGSNLTLAPFQSVYLVYSIPFSSWLRADLVSGGGGGGGVLSVFGRTGAVTAQTGDYNASQITNAVSTASTYANPSWITSLAYSKLTGAPTLRYQTLRVNAGTDQTQRSRLNFVAGTGVTITATDDAAGNETDVQISATGGGGGGPTTKTYMAAKCQNTVAGAGFSLAASNAPTAICDSGANTLFGVLRFTANGQSAQDAFPLPPSFSSMTITMTGRTASTSGNSVFGLETACIGDDEALGSGGANGPSWNPIQTISLPAKATANRNTVSGETAVTATGCGANELFLFRISRDASTTTADPELIAVSFKVQ